MSFAFSSVFSISSLGKLYQIISHLAYMNRLSPKVIPTVFRQYFHNHYTVRILKPKLLQQYVNTDMENKLYEWVNEWTNKQTNVHTYQWIDQRNNESVTTHTKVCCQVQIIASSSSFQSVSHVLIMWIRRAIPQHIQVRLWRIKLS